MKSIFGILGIVIVAAIVLYVATTQLKTVAPGAGTTATNPKGTIHLQGVRTDLMQYSRIEQQHLASDGHYVSLSEIRSGDTGVPPESRGPYTYDISVSESSFTVTATYRGDPPSGTPRTLSIGPEGTITTE